MKHNQDPRASGRAESLRRFRRAFPVVQTLAFVLLTVIAFPPPPAAQADLETAIQAFNNGQRESAIAELHKLAREGDTQAKYTLGLIYTEGRGVAADYEQALKWFREAASEGNPNAQYSLGVLHARGIGVPQDLVRALMWLNIALKDRDSHTAFRLQVVSAAALLKKNMTPEQIAEAGKLSSDWGEGAE